MSANISYRQVKPQAGKCLGVMAPSSFIREMDHAFGSLPLQLDKGAIPTLRGMSATQPDHDNPYSRLIEAIKRLGEVEIYAEY